MANRKARPKSKTKSKPLIQLAPERQEEIAAIGLSILAVLTALGAFNLSGGTLLGPWVQFLQTIFGWGVFLAPLIFLGLAIWLFLDTLDRAVNIGWERPLGLAMAFFLLLALFQWIGAPDLMQVAPAHGGGGMIGWAIASALAQALGKIGSALALGAMAVVVLILLFNLSLVRVLQRMARPIQALARSLSNIGHHILKRSPRRRPSTRVAPPAEPEFAPLTPARPRASLRPVEEEQLEPPVEIPADFEPAPPPEAEPEIPWQEPLPEPPVEPHPAVVPPEPMPEYTLPEIPNILEEGAEQDISPQEIRLRVHQIEETLLHFGVPAKVIEVNQGPSITQFGVEPGFTEQKAVDGKIHRVKVKVSRISALQHDLELALAAAPIRIEAPVPGRPIVGIEVPNSHIAVVSLLSVIESETFKKKKGKLLIALGQDVEGQPVCADLTSMPHLLIAGATGSGKSVCINTIIAALLCTRTPAEVRFVMIDPKRVELVNFNPIPHLLRPVVVEVNGAVAALQDAVKEMDERFKLFAEMGKSSQETDLRSEKQPKTVRNIDAYNQAVEGTPEKKLPYIVIIVDELADLMMVAAEEVERTITRLAQMARATGIHLILATQRPSVDVVTGLIKANFPARISFAVTSQVDSRVVLDTPGAEKLLGRGDMLYMASDSSKLRRLQGCFVSDAELEKLVEYWKEFPPPPGTVEQADGSSSGTAAMDTPVGGPDEDILSQAIEVVKKSPRPSVSLLQRKLRIGYSRASRLMDTLKEKGIVGPDEGPAKCRPVLTPEPQTAPPAEPSQKEPSRADPEEEPDFSDFTEKDWEDLDKA